MAERCYRFNSVLTSCLTPGGHYSWRNGSLKSRFNLEMFRGMADCFYGLSMNHFIFYLHPCCICFSLCIAFFTVANVLFSEMQSSKTLQHLNPRSIRVMPQAAQFGTMPNGVSIRAKLMDLGSQSPANAKILRTLPTKRESTPPVWILDVRPLVANLFHPTSPVIISHHV